MFHQTETEISFQCLDLLRLFLVFIESACKQQSGIETLRNICYTDAGKGFSRGTLLIIIKDFKKVKRGSLDMEAELADNLTNFCNIESTL